MFKSTFLTTVISHFFGWFRKLRKGRWSSAVCRAYQSMPLQCTQPEGLNQATHSFTAEWRVGRGRGHWTTLSNEHEWTWSTRVLQTYTKSTENTIILVCHWFLLTLCWFFYCSQCVAQKNECSPAQLEKLLHKLRNLLAEQHTPHCRHQSVQSHFCTICESADWKQHSYSGLAHQRDSYSEVVPPLLFN